MKKTLLHGTGLGGGLAFAFLAQGCTLLVNVFLSLVVARRLPVEDFAYWQLFTFYNAFAGLAALGVEHGVYLRCAGLSPSGLDAPLQGGQFRFLAVYALACGGAVAGLAAALVPNGPRRTVLLAVAGYLVLVTLTGFLDCLFQAVGQTRVYSTAVIVTRVVFLLLAAGLLLAGVRRFQALLWCWLCAQGLGLAFACVAARRVVTARGAPLRGVFKELMRNSRAGLPLLLAAFAGGMLAGSGRLVADQTFGIAVFGQFSFALALVNMLGQFVGQVGMVLFPAMKRAGQDALAPAWRLVDVALHLFLPLLLLFYAPARALLGLWLPRYAQSLALLALLLPLCLFDGKTQILYNTWLKVHRREKAMLAVNAAGVGAALALSLAAARLWGRVEGVALALVAASVLRGWLGRRCTGLGGNSVAHLLLAAVFMAGTWLLPPLAGFLVMLSACAVFWLASRARWRELAALWREAPWKS